MKKGDLNNKLFGSYKLFDRLYKSMSMGKKPGIRSMIALTAEPVDYAAENQAK